MKTGILGGSFNPIHNAHIELCELARRRLELDRILLIPTGDNPFKETENLVSRFERYEMTKLAVIDKPYYEVSDIEVNREGVSYTIDTVSTLKNGDYADDKLYFIIGSDIIYHLGEWKSIKRLSRLITFICVSRAGIDNTELYETKAALYEKYETDIILIDDENIANISSTAVRALAKRHDPELEKYVDEKVYRYITERSLYD